MLRHVCIFFIRCYKVLLSPLMNAFSGPGGCCRYTPGCSQYGIDAITRYGSFRGSWLTLLRLLRCAPWGWTGYDPVPATFSWRWWPTAETETDPAEAAHAHNHQPQPEPGVLPELEAVRAEGTFSPRTRMRRLR